MTAPEEDENTDSKDLVDSVTGQSPEIDASQVIEDEETRQKLREAREVLENE